ncbi:MAG: tetratricopeptide repeat protein, partial [Planctomycetota bacterium]
HPECAEIYAAIADSLLDRRMHDRAIWCLREAGRLDPDLPRLDARLAEGFAASGRHERARQLLLRELRRDPGDVETLLTLGEVLTEMNRPAEAAEKYRRVLELEPDNADAHAALGDLARGEGHLAEAIASLDMVIRLDPGDHETRINLAECLLDRGRPSDVQRAAVVLIEFVRELGGRSGDDSTLPASQRERVATLLLDAGRPVVACELLETAAGVDGCSVKTLHLYSVALFVRGDHAAGSAVAERILAVDPRNVDALHNLAVAALRDGRWLAARQWLRRGFEIAPDDTGLRRLRTALLFRALLTYVGRLSRRGRGALSALRGVFGRPSR